VAAIKRVISDCDNLAGSELDRARPPEVPGVPFDKLDADSAIPACEKAVQDNPRVIRFLFNLGRAYQRLAARPSLDKDKRITALRKARLAYDDATKRGYVSALNNLAVLYEDPEGTDFNEEEAASLLKRAAQQGHALAMYNLALHYRDGTFPIKRDVWQAREWFAKSAESGFVSAMVEYGRMLKTGAGLPSNNPRRAVEWLQRAAEAGSPRAKLELGLLYLNGQKDYKNDTNTVRPDAGLALLWFGRVAETGDSAAQYFLAQMMECGCGLPNPQPEIAERYWRLAAHGGDSRAQLAFAERLREGLVLVKQEHGEREVVTLLRRAMAQGSANAALDLAQIYRAGEFGEQKDPLAAMQLAYRAIQLSTQSDPTTAEGNPFFEIAAAHLLVEMAKNGEAVDAASRPLLTVAETERLERYYGAVDPIAKQVKVRRLDDVALHCGVQVEKVRVTWDRSGTIWVWDWGRAESPTEAQFRNLERTTGCADNGVLRRTMIDVFEQAKKSKVPFSDLIDQKIKTAAAAPDTSRRRRR
jgi:TPR repeat protein